MSPSPALSGLLALLTLAFGAAALRVAARLARQGAHRAPWALTGAAFTLAGAMGVLQAAAAAWAGAAGEASAVARTYARLHQPGEEGARMLLTGFACALLVLVSRRRLAAWPAPRTWGLLALCAVAGVVMGGALAEDPGARPESPLATVASAVTVLALLGALWCALLNDALDYLLWTALALHAVRVAVDMNALSALGWLGAAALRMPTRGALDWTAAATYAAMLALALMRMRLARGGRAAPGLSAAVAAWRWRTPGAPAPP